MHGHRLGLGVEEGGIESREALRHVRDRRTWRTGPARRGDLDDSGDRCRCRPAGAQWRPWPRGCCSAVGVVSVRVRGQRLSSRPPQRRAGRPELPGVVAHDRAGLGAPGRSGWRSPGCWCGRERSTTGPGWVGLVLVVVQLGRWRCWCCGPGAPPAPPTGALGELGRRRDRSRPGTGSGAPATSPTPGWPGGSCASTSTPRRRPAPAGERRPALLQVHGGAWVIGDKREQGIPLMRHLAGAGLGVLQRQLPAQPRRHLARPPRRPQAGPGVHPRARRRVRRRPRLRGRHRRLRRGPPGRHARPHRGRPPLPARLRGRRHLGAGGRPLLRRLRLHQPLRDHAAAVP